MKKFVDSQITKEKTLAAGQETKAQLESKESPESPMRATQFSRFGIGVMERPSPEVKRATSDARSRIVDKMRELPVSITKNQGSLVERANVLDENKHMVRSLIAVNERSNQHHPKWNK